MYIDGWMDGWMDVLSLEILFFRLQVSQAAFAKGGREREKERKGKGWVAKRMRRLAAVKGLPQQPKVVRKVGAFSQVGHNASNHYDPDFYFHHLHNRPSE